MTFVHFLLGHDDAVPAVASVSTSKKSLITYFQVNDILILDLKDAMKLHGVSLDGSIELVFTDPRYNVHQNLSRAVVQFDRFTKIDTGDAVDLCGHILTDRFTGHLFCFDMPFTYRVRKVPDCMDTVTVEN